MTAVLTERQGECLAAIEALIERLGVPPTFRELADELGVTSSNGVNDLLCRLERKGFITRVPWKSRGIRVVKR